MDVSGVGARKVGPYRRWGGAKTCLEGGDQGKDVGAVERGGRRGKLAISGSLIRAGRQAPQMGGGRGGVARRLISIQLLARS